jgi:Glyoxalase/Bleomycin resistance protein/Dioxygenase superfamily
MNFLTLHHYGFLTSSTSDWLAENESLLGKPFRIFNTIKIESQKVYITFVQQTEGEVLTELVEPWEDNSMLRKMIAKGISVYHKGFIAAEGQFDSAVKIFEEKGMHSLPVFQSEAFGNKRCIFFVTGNLGLVEIIEQ